MYSPLCILVQNVSQFRPHITTDYFMSDFDCLVYQFDINYGIEVWHMITVTFGIAIIVWAFFHFIVRPKQMKVLDQIRNNTRTKKEGCLDRLEKKLGWDAETRRLKKLDKEAALRNQEEMMFLNGPQTTITGSTSDDDNIKKRPLSRTGSTHSRISSISHSR